MRGPRKAGFSASCKRLGFAGEIVWKQVTPWAISPWSFWMPSICMGQRLAASSDPFDVWWQSKILENHGLDFTQPEGPLNDVLIDWRSI
jgi:hypothetical protein